MSTSATAAPSAANACAAARPIPEPAPVTSATLFSRDKFIGRFLLHLMCCLHVLLGLGPVLRRFECRRAFPERPCRPHFRCTHRRSALAERANLLAKYARGVERVCVGESHESIGDCACHLCILSLTRASKTVRVDLG